LFSAGCARVRCPEGELEYLLPFSCKQRYLCPSCHQRKSLLWADWLADEVMDLGVPHRQWVFTIPKRIRRCAGPPSFRFDPSLLGELPRVAARVLTAFFAEVSGRPDLKPGIVSVTQTFNSDLTWNPHAHQFATDGVLGPDGSFQRVSITRRRDLKLIEEAFRREVLGLLQARELLTEGDGGAEPWRGCSRGLIAAGRRTGSGSTMRSRCYPGTGKASSTSRSTCPGHRSR